ncbi:MAG: exodeoxyribonuclease V beta subunit [Myxococcota bacterium]|jgi:exodeoxyribonuclease V beta subunit
MPSQTWSAIAPLERGTALIEASAGTGKTYNITSLVLRLVAEEGTPIERILVVTYTRAATAELCERIRTRLVEAVDALAQGESPDDPVLEHVWSVAPAARSVRLRRLRVALESFDQALISTIHGFCQRMLQQNAFESGVAFDLELVPDTAAIVEEIVDDFLANTFYEADAAQIAFSREFCGFDRPTLLRLAADALADPDAAVVPGPDSADPAAWPEHVRALALDWSGLAESFVQRVADEVAAAKSGQPSVFTKRQRKQSEKAAREWVDGVAQWLASDPPFGAIPPEPERFSPAKTKAQLADADVPLQHACLDRLGALCAFPREVAGARRAAFVAHLRTAFDLRKDSRRIQTYQDLLRGLASRLGEDADPGSREGLAAAIGGMFDAALIDEFQDTDHHQWTIFREVFGRGAHHLYLIGDPKQAIYGFRGANVHVYSEATQHAGERRYTMATNWRSDRRLLDGLNHLLDQPGAFGPSVSFGYVAVGPPPGRGEDGLRPVQGWGNAEAVPLQLRWFDGALISASDPTARVTKGKLEGCLEARVADDIVALLRSGTTIRAGEDWRPVRPADVAVLVRKGRQAVALQEALRRVGVPAVLTGAASVLASDEARQVQHWLEALAERPGGSASRVAASTVLFGWSAAALLQVESEVPAMVARWDRWLGRVSDWAVTLRRQGFMAAFRRALRDQGVLARLLTLEDGERRVTNLLHVAELVHAAETRERLHLSALLAWFAARRSADDLDSDDAELRLDRDAEAVHLLTVHKSKGLEFPVCFVPYLWDGGLTKPRAGAALVVPDPGRRTRRLLDVGVPTEAAHQDLAEREAKEEALRLAYVALTRARHRCVVYAGLATDYEHSPLSAILHGSGADRIRTGTDRVEQAEGALREDIQALADRSVAEDGAARVGVLDCEAPVREGWTAPPGVEPVLSSRVFQRPDLDPGWRRHSYTSVTRAAGHPTLVEEGREGFDPDAIEAPVVTSAPGAVVEEVPLAPFHGGAEAGTLLHHIFEKADFQDGDSASKDRFRAVVTDALRTHGFEVERHADVLVPGLRSVLHTPLGSVLGELRLADLPRQLRLDELRFDLPILGGTQYRGGSDRSAPARGLVAALRSRRDGILPDDWLASLNRLDGLELAGFLTGSIDLVFRVPTPGSQWFVVDYKSNRIDPGGTGRCVPEAFDVPSMTAEMARHDYFLQYHLYVVALHRILRWRIPDYDYDRHIGGVYYLFFRGMVGPETERDGDAVRGCWFDRPPRAVIEALDRALASDDAEGAR